MRKPRIWIKYETKKLSFEREDIVLLEIFQVGAIAQNASDPHFEQNALDFSLSTVV